MSAQFKTATDFRRSIEAKLASLAKKTGEDLQRLRRKLAFDRLLARIFGNNVAHPRFLLKGGYAMELRFVKARATKDIDLTFLDRFQVSPNLDISKEIHEELIELCTHDLGDYFIYRIGEAQLDLDNAPYGGARYPVTAFLDDRLFVGFKIDIGLDVLVDQIEVVKGYDWLDYCHIQAPSLPAITIEQQFAEKVHAYSMPRDKPNSRVKDLIDLLLLSEMRKFNMGACNTALKTVFGIRETHILPAQLSVPPESWKVLYKKMALECSLEPDIQIAFNIISQFYSSVIQQ